MLDREYLDFKRSDTMYWQGYFFVKRIKKHTKVRVLETVVASKCDSILSAQMVA
ncbi:hypothetical protein [Carnobacterium iners]|uniref:hypothetical protein n=1 Tax=Carnobacterium iners TaxID=1073423 RepID=UPI00135668BD|nr:hypothetical protein [Carnobacterium iners]